MTNITTHSGSTRGPLSPPWLSASRLSAVTTKGKESTRLISCWHSASMRPPR